MFARCGMWVGYAILLLFRLLIAQAGLLLLWRLLILTLRALRWLWHHARPRAAV